MKFIHLSDLHIHSTRNTEETVYAFALVQGIIAKYKDSDDKPWIVITGDIVEDATEKQYVRAVEILFILKDKGFTLLIQPGNHDYGLKGNIYGEIGQARFQKYILAGLLKDTDAATDGLYMEDLYPRVIEHEEGIVFIELDSMQAIENKLAHFARGRISKKQLVILSDQIEIAKNNGKKIVVCMHHHPFYRGELAKPFMAMENAEELMSILKGKIDILCFGHKHISNVWSYDANRDMDGYSQKYRIPWIIASGKSTEKTRDGKLYFREIEINEDTINVSEVKIKLNTI